MGKNKTKEFVIKVLCAKCGTLLYVYRKEGAGSLVKCYVEGILEDRTRGDLKCHQCGQQFARLAKYHNRPAHKIIQGKVVCKGSLRQIGARRKQAHPPRTTYIKHK